MKPTATLPRLLSAGALCALPLLAPAEEFTIPLQGFQEAPAVSTDARGLFSAQVSWTMIRYELRYRELEGSVSQAHIHFGQRGANGGVSVFLCQSATAPDPTGLAPTCPAAPATVRGVLTAANVIGPAGQGIAAGEFAELIKAIRAGKAYVNVHSSTFPSGEVRGQTHGH